MPAKSPPTAWRWGQFRADATRYAPRINWSLLTDAQVDCLYLNAYSDATLSQRAIAAVYGVSCPTVNVHVRRGRAALVRAGRDDAVREVPEPPAPGSRVPCMACDTPWQDCTTCIERTFFNVHEHPVYQRTKHGRHRRQLQPNEIAGGELPSAVNLETQGHRRRDADWELGVCHVVRRDDGEASG